MTFRTIAKHLWPQSYALTSALGSNGPRIVVYHDISDGKGPYLARQNVSTPQAVFDEHLDIFQRNYEIIDLRTLASGKCPKRALLITFDDTYRSVLTGAKALKTRGLPAVCFLNTNPIARRGVLFENLLCFLIGQFSLGTIEGAITGVPPRCRTIHELVMGVVAMLPGKRRKELCTELCQKFLVENSVLEQIQRLYLDREDIPSLVSLGCEIANHGAEHLHLRCLNSQHELNEEICDAAEELRKWSGQPVRAFSCPYGRREDMPESVVATAREAGHDLLFLAEGLANRNGRYSCWNRTVLSSEPSGELFRAVEMYPRARRFKKRTASPAADSHLERKKR